jgi:hypothetical protein
VWNTFAASRMTDAVSGGDKMDSYENIKNLPARYEKARYYTEDAKYHWDLSRMSFIA